MVRDKNIVAAFLVTIALGVGIAVRGQGAVPSAEAIATDRIKNLSLTLVVRETHRDELKKMKGAFATNYTVKRMKVFYSYPNKARFEGKVSGASGTMVYNGDKKMFSIIGIRKVMNTYGQPGQKQSLLDLGIFATDYLTTDYQANYQRTEDGLQVYKLSQRNTSNTSHEIVWVNPKTSVIEKRFSYNGDNILQKEIRFVKPVEVQPGIWVPTRVEIYNQFGKLGVAQSVEEVKVNAGVDEKLFEIS